MAEETTHAVENKTKDHNSGKNQLVILGTPRQDTTFLMIFQNVCFWHPDHVRFLCNGIVVKRLKY